MKAEELHVWRDCYGRYDKVGSLRLSDRGWVFAYNPEYTGPPISTRLPLRRGDFTESETSVFFSALSPEGQAKADFLHELRADNAEYEPLLRRLNNESQGALVFSSTDSAPGEQAAYTKLDADFFEKFAASPLAVAVETMGRTRLSLSGAMAKVGLYRSPGGNWYLPTGSAPSNYIVKAGSASFPFEIVNEALCLETARRCEYDVPPIEVLATDSGPLLAIGRYDRVIPKDPFYIDGLPVPKRLHQEDFCQLCGIPSSWKYEPTDGAYLELSVSNIIRTCTNAFGETQLFLSYVLFDYLMGNCDNHLKNYSILYSDDWHALQMAPRHDIVSTTLYPNLYTEMGISLQPSRSVFGLTQDAIERTLSAAKLSTKLGKDEFYELADSIPKALNDARDYLVKAGFPEVCRVADAIRDGVQKRAEFSFSSDSAKTLA